LKRASQLSFLVTIVVNSVTLAQSPHQKPSSTAASEAEIVRAAAKPLLVARGNVRIEVIAQGSGPVIVILPSLGRGAEDYDVVAARLAAHGYRVLRPQARGIGASTGPMSRLTLHDYAADVSTVIEQEGKGPVVVVGHAFGNFVARMLATDRPDLVRGVVLAAASAGKVPPGVHESSVSPEVREAINKSGDLSLPEAERLRYLQRAFFAPGHDPHVWLSGWYPEAMKAESAAEAATPVDAWFACGNARILDLQAENDAVAPRKFAGVLKAALGDRVTVVVIRQAGHALVPEQPQAMARAIEAFSRTLKDPQNGRQKKGRK
jgi:pimeloyl-ACP methyl ester carboxylesterase